jgi:hypothetical protein
MKHLIQTDLSISLEKIPDDIYHGMVDMFTRDYHFNNGARMRLSNYFVKIERSLSSTLVKFIDDMTTGLSEGIFPSMLPPNGFKPDINNLTIEEAYNGFTFGSFDMAVTDNGLQNIEFQAVATYPISAAKLNQYLLEHHPIANASIFADSADTTWDDFIDIYQDIIAGGQTDGVVLTDRKIAEQKTNFEFFATKNELNIPLEIVDMDNIFESKNELMYKDGTGNNQKINRLYNRVLLVEALYEDNYPEDKGLWKFRFDHSYNNLTFVNHPIKQFEVSKRLSPYIKNSCNPPCFEMSEVAKFFEESTLNYEDYIWKHKWGAAGHGLILNPSANILSEIQSSLSDYIAQKKVDFTVFTTDDGQEKIVELRFMTASHNNRTVIVPMARIGQVEKDDKGVSTYKIHFSDNNKAGYGFAPVVIID